MARSGWIATNLGKKVTKKEPNEIFCEKFHTEPVTLLTSNRKSQIPACRQAGLIDYSIIESTPKSQSTHP